MEDWFLENRAPEAHIFHIHQVLLHNLVYLEGLDILLKPAASIS